MPDFSQRLDLPSFITWYAWHLRQGESTAQIDAKAAADPRWVDLVGPDLAIVREQALLIYNTPGLTRLLQPNEPLSTILGGETPPSQDIYINFSVAFGPPGSKPNDPNTEWKSIQWRGTWDTPWYQILEFIQFNANEMALQATMGKSPLPQGYEVLDYFADSTIWFPHPQQQ